MAKLTRLGAGEGDDGRINLNNVDPSRRGFLIAVSGAVPAMVAGCMGGDEEDPIPDDDSDGSGDSGDGDSGDGGSGGTTITAASRVEVESMDPFQTLIGPAAGVRNLVFDNLIWRGPQGELVPSVASEMPMVSDDGLEYVFDIRDDVQFHSGSDMTANDVAYSWNWFLDPENDVVNAGRFTGTMSPNVEAEDNTTVRFQLEETWSPWMTYGFDWHGLVEENSREEIDDWTFPNGPGSGPGIPADYDVGNYWEYEANDDYWHDTIPQWDRYRIEVLTSATTRAVRLRESEIDLESDHSPIDHAELSDTDGIQTDSQPQTLGMNALYVKSKYKYEREGETSPFESIHNRKAIQYSIPREQIAENLWNGLLSPTAAFCSPEAWFYSEDMEMYEYDPEMVQHHLDEAGNPDGFEFRFVTQQDSPYSDIAELLQSEWEQYGINATINQMDRGSAFGQFNSDGWDLACVFSQLAPEPDEMNLWMDSDGPYAINNDPWFGWEDLHPEEADRTTELIQQGRELAEQDARAGVYAEMGEILADISAMIFIGSVHTTVGYQDNITNVKAPNDGVLRHKVYGKE